MPRNTTGGKNFKKFKTGSEGYRARAAREAADDIVELIIKAEKKPEKMDEEDKKALRLVLVGRVVKRFGNGRNEVYCHDGGVRQCVIRGLLRKKGQVFIDIGSLVVVSLRDPLDSSSSDEDGLGKAAVADGTTADIVGLLDDRHIAMLRLTQINKRVFSESAEQESEDIFDRSDQVNAFIDSKKDEEDIDLDKI
jgi:translation initiation factor IF-1